MPLKEAIADYLLYLQYEQGALVSTIRSYRPSLHRWEDGRWNELVISGLDPARPEAKEAYHWSASRDGLSIFPSWGPGLLRSFSHPNSGYKFDFHYSRVGDESWPTSERSVGAWVTRLGPNRYRTREGQMPPRRANAPGRAAGGEFWIYRDGLPRRHGRWTGSNDGRSPYMTFAFVRRGSELSGEWWDLGGRYDWTTQRAILPQSEPVGAPARSRRFPAATEAGRLLGTSLTRAGGSGGPQAVYWGVAYPSSTAGAATPTGDTARRRVLDYPPGGARRPGIWREDGPPSRPILIGFDPERPDRETEWHWEQHAAFSGRVRQADGEVQQAQFPERLNLVDATSPMAQPEDGTFVELVRVRTVSKPTR